jgi:DNA-directed RNA polymerase specialized sigma24 family protein
VLTNTLSVQKAAIASQRAAVRSRPACWSELLEWNQVLNTETRDPVATMAAVNFPNMEAGYKQFRGLLLDALGRLARRGLAVQPADGLDLINTFFADEWDGLVQRYDPNLGSIPTYVYGAFLRFARPRIISLRRWSQPIADLSHVVENFGSHSEPSAADALVRKEEHLAIEEALTELPSQTRDVFLDYLTLGPRSQRQLARKYKFSRYRVHELLIRVIGRLIVRLEESGAWTLPDRDVAYLLWSEGRTLEETATRLDRPIAEIRESRRRLVELLGDVLINAHLGRTRNPKGCK